MRAPFVKTVMAEVPAAISTVPSASKRARTPRTRRLERGGGPSNVSALRSQMEVVWIVAGAPQPLSPDGSQVPYRKLTAPLLGLIAVSGRPATVLPAQ